MDISKEKIKVWLKDKHNFTFILLIIVAILLRGYYFSVTDNQPLWWDEAGYMASAKAYAGIGSYALESIRSSGFSRTMSIFYLIGIENEGIIRFFGLLIPSIILLILTYILLSRMYEDRRIALIGTAIMVVLWENVFYSNRFHTENFALIFQYIALIALIGLYNYNSKLSKSWSIGTIIVSVILMFWYRPGNIIFIPAAIAFIALMHAPKFTNTKNKKIITIASILAIIVLFFILLNSFAENPLVATYYHPDYPISWNSLNVFLGFFKSPISWLPSLFFYAFLIGIFGALFTIYLYFPQILKEPNQLPHNVKGDILNVLILLSVMIGFILLIRPTAFEYRWFFPLLPALLGFTASGVITFSDWFSQKLGKKNISIFIIFIIVILGIYTQITIIDPLAKSKSTSYDQIKQAVIWFNENVPADEIVLSTSTPQIAYYSERETITYSSMSLEEFEDFLSNHKSQYLLVSVFEGNPPWLIDWINTNKDILTPLQAYNLNGQTAAIIYLVKTT